MRPVLVCAVLLSGSILFPFTCVAQSSDSSQGESAICAFEDGKQLTAHYNPVTTTRTDGPPVGKVLTPGGSAMTFFTETDLVLGQSTIPTGGYTMYLIPAKKEWTLIVSKNTAVGAKYDEKLDLARGQWRQDSSPLRPKKCRFISDTRDRRNARLTSTSGKRAAGLRLWRSSPIVCEVGRANRLGLCFVCRTCSTAWG